MTCKIYYSYFYPVGSIHLFEAMQIIHSTKLSIPSLFAKMHMQTQKRKHIWDTFTQIQMSWLHPVKMRKKGTSQREREREREDREREREKVREDAAADFRLSHLARDCGSIYLASDGCDIYGRKKPFQGFEGMAEALRWRLWLRPGQRWSWLGLGPLGIGEALWSQWWLRVFCPDTLTKKLRERKPTCVRVCVRLASRVSLLCLHHTYMYCMHAQPHTHTHTLRPYLSVKVWMGTVKVSI